MTEKQIQKINKSYAKRFKMYSKNFFKDNTAGLLIFIEYLKYLKDRLIITCDNDVSWLTVNENVSTITAAIAEFDAYCLADDQEQRTFHWVNFCETVKQNMGEWLSLNDSIQESAAT